MTLFGERRTKGESPITASERIAKAELALFSSVPVTENHVIHGVCGTRYPLAISVGFWRLPSTLNGLQ